MDDQMNQQANPMNEVVNPNPDPAPPLASPSSCNDRHVEVIEPGTFEPVNHFYPRVLNAQIHPLVRFFLNLGNPRIAKRYCHLHPDASPDTVSDVLHRRARFFQWGGADLFTTTSDRGQKRLVVVETNSCPSGQKSMPLANEDLEHAGYRTLLERSFMPALRANKGACYDGPLPEGGLAVLYDKNKMEAWGYAATLADLTSEPVLLVPFYADDLNPKARFRDDGVLEVRSPPHYKDACLKWASHMTTTPPCEDILRDSVVAPSMPSEDLWTPLGLDPREWVPIRAALRYVTQRPWTRIPPISRTLIYNPVLACLAGGRNKMLAAKAYDIFNADIVGTGLKVYTPDTIWDVTKREVPLWVQRMGGLAVVKVPYANAGQGVWTITHGGELEDFMATEHRYDRFIVQALIGNNGWSSVSHHGRLYHVGTVPNLKGNIYAADLRMMIGSSPEGFFPVAIYARRAKLPLAECLQQGAQSWDMLGTNLSVKNLDGTWGTESERLLLMDSRDFNRIGIGVDDLIEAYMQTVLAMLAIDNLACKLITPKSSFGMKLFQALNPDAKLLAELYVMQQAPTLQVQTQHDEAKDRQISITEDLLAEELEKEVEMVTSTVPNSNVNQILTSGVRVF